MQPNMPPSSIKKHTNHSPDSFHIDTIESKPITDAKLISKMRDTMEAAIKNSCYKDAIFFADKILALSI